MQKIKVLVLGATGMLGHVVFKHFYAKPAYQVFGTVRSLGNLNNFFSADEQSHLIGGVEAENFDSFICAFETFIPDVVINCIGIIKQSADAKNYYDSITVNSLLPHRLAKLCAISRSRLIHISSDCVFDGKKGNYLESDNANATDLYGKSKFLGEADYPHATTIRTSIIGHELNSSISLVDWFLSQTGKINGYTNAVFSGFTTYELTNIIQNYVIPNSELHGLYHISAAPISKYNLLKLIVEIYKNPIEIMPVDEPLIDRTLNSDKFRQLTGFYPKNWPQMIQEMHLKFITDAHLK